MANVLQIVESAYRATLEEQDDTVLWITAALRGAGAPIDLLLRGNAVNYAVLAPAPPALTYGTWVQSHPPDHPRDLGRLIAKGSKVYVVQDDVSARGIEPGELIDGVAPIDRGGVAALVARYPRVWAW